MRSIRRAALAGATAAALVLGAASAATADEDHASDGMSDGFKSLSSKEEKQGEEDTKGLSSILKSLSSKGEAAGEEDAKDLSSAVKKLPNKIGKTMDADQPVNGRDLFGSTTNADAQPAWAKYMKTLTIVSLVGSFLGLVVFPAYNFAVANHLIVK